MFRFAVMGAGNIARKFCDAVKRTPDAVICAVASKSPEKAETFAEAFGIENAYGSYADMLDAEKPDCVYIATLPSSHFELTMLCLERETPVLCEKAMFMSSNEARTAFALSEEKGLLAMEAMWSRFLPAVRQARQWLKEGRIGNPASTEMMIGFLPPDDPKHRCLNPELGGGTAFDITVYALEVLQYILDAEPLSWKCDALEGPTGVDLVDGALVRFPGTLAFLHTSFGGPMEERLVLYGPKGKILVPTPHYPSEAYLYDEKGNEVEHFRDTVTENGFVYEVAEAIRCVREHRYESPVIPHRDTLTCCCLFDDMMRAKERF